MRKGGRVAPHRRSGVPVAEERGRDDVELIPKLPDPVVVV